MKLNRGSEWIQYTRVRRKKAFEEFFNHLTDDNAQLAIINLAAEMAKKCKENR